MRKEGHATCAALYMRTHVVVWGMDARGDSSASSDICWAKDKAGIFCSSFGDVLILSGAMSAQQGYWFERYEDGSYYIRTYFGGPITWLHNNTGRKWPRSSKEKRSDTHRDGRFTKTMCAWNTLSPSFSHDATCHSHLVTAPPWYWRRSGWCCRRSGWCWRCVYRCIHFSFLEGELFQGVSRGLHCEGKKEFRAKKKKWPFILDTHP
jgi:hypothetical protein